MNYRHALVASFIGLVTWGTSSAQSILIDNFTTGSAPTGSTINLNQSGVGNVSSIFTGLAASTVINPTGGTDQGIRIARSHVTTGTNSCLVDNTGTNDQLNVSLGSATTGHFHLYYGFNDFNPALGALAQPGGNYADLARDLTGSGANNAITMTVLNPDHNGGIVVTLISGRGTGSQAIFTLQQPYVTGNPSTQILTFFFSDFTGINAADIDQIIVEPVGDILAAGDLSLDNIQATFAAVPEPATIAMMGLTGVIAAGGVWYRRRKQAALLNANCN